MSVKITVSKRRARATKSAAPTFAPHRSSNVKRTAPVEEEEEEEDNEEEENAGPASNEGFVDLLLVEDDDDNDDDDDANDNNDDIGTEATAGQTSVRPKRTGSTSFVAR